MGHPGVYLPDAVVCEGEVTQSGQFGAGRGCSDAELEGCSPECWHIAVGH